MRLYVTMFSYISLPDNVRAEGTVASLFQRTLAYITCVLHTPHVPCNNLLSVLIMHTSIHIQRLYI